jgi:hypothetical protein
MRKLIDVTIVYPDGVEHAWGFLCGKKSRIIVCIDVLPIDSSLRGQDPDDPEYKKRFNSWLNDLWEDKDIIIAREIKRMASHITPG